ncbi:MAG: TIGR03936 family radical SAM-associated protein [Planctomycetaceae bacterium]|nr:TIGR03936 family radical SAM-associated protein [Planctomycetaceae bacterium]
MVRQRVRLRFSKSGNLRYIGHNDLLRSFESLFRRVRLPLARSSGFHPKIRMSSPSALALGIEGLDEVLELEFTEETPPVNSDALLAALNKQSPQGLRFVKARMLNEQEKKARLALSVYHLSIPKEQRTELPEKIRLLLSQSSAPVQKKNGKTVDVRKTLSAIDFSPDTGLLTFELLPQTGPDAGVPEVLTLLGLGGELFKSIFPARTNCVLTKE